MLQQLLKLYAPSVLASLLVQSSELQSEKPAEQPQAFFLIADADTVWLQASDRSRGCTDKGHCLTAERACVCATLQDVDFVAYEPNDDQGAGHWVALLSTYGLGDATGLRSEADLARYDDFVEAIVPGLTKRRRCVETAVVHHTVPLHLAPPPFICFAQDDCCQRMACQVLERTVVDALFERVESGRGQGQSPSMLFWQHVRALALGQERTSQTSHTGMPVSEYELYFAFAWRFHRDRIRNRPLPFAVARDWKQWFRLSSKSEPGACPSPSGESTEVFERKSPVTYVVSHSHLRSPTAATAQKPAVYFREREGVINERHLQFPPGTPESRSNEARKKLLTSGPGQQKQLLAFILAQNGAFES